MHGERRRAHGLVLLTRVVAPAQMASVVGHPLWPLMQRRAATKCKETIGKRLDADAVMLAVGPWALTEEFRVRSRLRRLREKPVARNSTFLGCAFCRFGGAGVARACVVWLCGGG